MFSVVFVCFYILENCTTGATSCSWLLLPALSIILVFSQYEAASQFDVFGKSFERSLRGLMVSKHCDSS
jgi:hypothetical protein